MQRFEFPLEKALEWRTTRLKQEEAKLARLHQEKAALLRLRATLDSDIRESAEAVMRCSDQIGGTDLAWLAEFAAVTQSRLKSLEKQVRDSGRRIEEQTRVVIEASRQKQLLEDLKKHQFDEWALEDLKKHQFDEWALEVNREIENTAGDLFLAGWERRR